MEVGIITYEKGKNFYNCLYALQREGFEPIVVCTHPFNDLPKSLRVIHLPENPGYGKAINTILTSTDDHCLILNDDIMIPKHQIEILQEEIELSQVPCIIQPKLDFGNGEMENYGHHLWIDAFNSARFRGEESSSIPVSNPIVFSGAAFVIHRDVIHKVGLFSDDLIFYGEEVDYILRMFQHDLFVKGSGATLIHGYGESLGDVYSEKTYLIERNRQRILQHFYPKTCMANALFGVLLRRKKFSTVPISEFIPAILGILSGMRYGYKNNHKSNLSSPSRRLTYSQLWNLICIQQRQNS